MLYAFTHPIAILMILSFAKTRGYNVLMCYLPIALLNFILGTVTLMVKMIMKSTFATSESFTSMSAKHIFVLGFVYTFGYLIPTLRLI